MGNIDEPTKLDMTLDHPCQIHGTDDKPATHTNRNCSVFRQAVKVATEGPNKPKIAMKMRMNLDGPIMEAKISFLMR